MLGKSSRFSWKCSLLVSALVAATPDVRWTRREQMRAFDAYSPSARPAVYRTLAASLFKRCSLGRGEDAGIGTG